MKPGIRVLSFDISKCHYTLAQWNAYYFHVSEELTTLKNQASFKQPYD